MCRFRSIICVFLMVLMLFSVSINPAVAQNNTDSDSVVTSHEPKTRMSEVKKDTGKKSSKTWLWVLLGAVVVAGGVAALASGGSSDSGSSGGGTTDNTSTTGNYDFSW